MKKLSKGWVAVLFLIGFFLSAQAGGAAALKDTESASHADTASQYDLVDTYTYPGFSILQFNLAVLSHYSYMLVSGNEALVVDPGRDVFAYLALAKEKKLTIKGVLLSHSHADFVAGHTELAFRADCPVYISKKAGAGYPHVPLEDGSQIRVGSALIKVLETPGHTLDCTTSLVYSQEDNKTPRAMFTGDTLFVGSVGRPDLMGGTMSAAALASLAYDSWTKKLSPLDDSVVIFPAHGAGSLCGAHLSDDPFSTVGRERKTNVYLQYRSRSDFIAAVLEGLPDAPQYFKHNAAMNKKGPERVNWEPPAPGDIAPDRRLMEASSVYVVDLRDAALYARGHIPNSVNIAIRGRLETWVGIMVPWGADLVLTGSRDELIEAVYRLHRVGYTAQTLGFDAWQAASLPVKTIELTAPADLYDQMNKGTAPVIVDVRLPSEWMGLRIGQVINLPLNQLSVLSSKLDPEQPVVAVCNSAYRSSMAMGILERNGFNQVSSLNGGSQAWITAGYPVFGAQTSATPAAAAPRKEVKLPDRISPLELKSLIMDLPGTFDLVDIRPSQYFNDFHLPGAMNADIADVLNNPAFLVGTGPLVIVDRDGSLAMVAAGMLFNKTQRPIKALRGGIEAYWQQSDLPSMATSGSTMPAGRGDVDFKATPGPVYKGSTPVTPPATAPAPAVPKPSVKKSAGC